MHRVLALECGLTETLDRSPKPIGSYEHWYRNNFVDDSSSTQYFSYCYLIELSKEQVSSIKTDQQHSDVKWLTKEEILDDASVHAFTKYFFCDNPPNRLM